ncbi:MAG TPA: hypothetical protein VMR99_01315 [Candidatus Paceibacterota bacterium]|nr:hypothetical protein [Candidatus Paceibacterota bacterium]
MDNPLSKVLTNAPPPPPSEIKIRTMRSDIDSMMKSGGGAPSFQNVAVSGLSLEREYKAPVSSQTPMPDLGSFSIPAPPPPPAVARTSSFAPDLSSAPVSAPAAQEFTPVADSGPNIVPIVIVTLVAILAIGVVAYFAYTIFAK